MKADLAKTSEATESQAPKRKASLLRRFLLFFALVFLALAVVSLGYELLLWVETGRYRVLTLGELWYSVDPGGLNLAQAIVQRYVSPDLWDGPILALLLRPGWPTFAFSGVLLLIVTRLFRRA